MQSLSPPPALSWHERTRALVRSLPDFLTWTDGLALVDDAHEIYGVWMDKRLYTWAKASGQPLRERLASLPIPHRGRLRQAPRFFHLLRTKREPGAEELRALHQFIDVEEYLCGRRKDIAPDSWSALGDYCSGAASADHPAPAEPAAPRVRGIVLDVNSPNMKTYGAHPNLGALQPYTPAEIPAIVTPLERGFSCVESISSTASAMTRSAISVIAALRGSANHYQTSSGSERWNLGMASLANLDSRWWTPEVTADALVHEAIHAVVYRLELIEFLHLDDPASLTQQATSPWSGRALSLRSFVHACFVWYGLWHLWQMRPSGHRAIERRDAAQKGFVGNSPASLLTADCLANLQPHVRTVLDDMFERVNRGVRPATAARAAPTASAAAAAVPSGQAPA